MAFDTIVANAGRLEILAALAVEETQDFVMLRQRTRMTDGNLSSHARRLESAGLVLISKSFREGKPVTQFQLTGEGRRALEAHVRRLMSALSQKRVSGPAQVPPSSPVPPPLATPALPPQPPVGSPPSSPLPPALEVPVGVGAGEEEWVD